MNRTTKEQINTSFESPLWEELSDEAAAACVGGAQGKLKELLKGIIYRFLQVIGWTKAT